MAITVPGPVEAGGALLAPRAPHRYAAHAANAVLALALLLGVVALAGIATGYRGAVVLTGSMRPSIEPGDIVVTRTVAAAEIATGDVITFTAPGGGHTITHRVRNVLDTGRGQLEVVTRGDANSVVERWTTTPDARVGRVRAVVPKAGYLTRWAADPALRTAVFLLLGAGLLVVGLRWAWRR